MNCATCSKALHSRNRSGYCRKHFGTAFERDRDAAARKQAKMRQTMSDPVRHAARVEQLRVASRARLSWCPPEYLADYRRMTRIGGFRAQEARAVIEAELPGTRAHARRLIANTNFAMRLKQEREQAQAY
jgi:hypothetical protein